MSARTLLMAAATAGPPGASLNLSFMSGTLDPMLTFTRGSTATYFDSSGTMQTAAINAARFDCDPVTHAALGLLIEEQRTNVLLNTATLGTQSVAVTAQAYTLSFYGTGTITKSGTAAGALVGTGAFPQRVSQTFTPTAGTLTLTVTGSVLNAQLEAGSFVTSYIPVAGVAVTRNGEICSAPTGSWFSAGASSASVDAVVVGVGASGLAMLYTLGDAPASNRFEQLVSSGNSACSFIMSAGVASVSIPEANIITFGVPFKIGGSLQSGRFVSAFNGGALYTNTTSIVLPVGVNSLVLGSLTSTYFLNGHIRRMRYWPRALSNSELQSVTT